MQLSLDEIAARQLADYRNGDPGTYFGEDRPPLSVEDAYLIQKEVMRLREQDGDEVAGYKVGCTGANIRKLFGLDGPIRGFVYGPELHESGSSISHSEFSSLAIEGEIAVRLGADLEPASLMAVIELHNLVLRSSPRSLQELIANNGIHAGVVLPSAAKPWAERPKRGSLRVFVDGRVIEESDMYGVPGGPEGSLAWLKRNLRDHELDLRPGMLILTGTALGLNPVRPGHTVRVEAGGLEPVEMKVVP